MKFPDRPATVIVRGPSQISTAIVFLRGMRRQAIIPIFILYTLLFNGELKAVCSYTSLDKRVHVRVKGESTDTMTTMLPEVDVISEVASKNITGLSPIYEIDSDKIINSGITDISDAIKRLPGINLRDYGGAGGLKTVSVRGLSPNHTGVSYDGIPLSDCQSGQIDLSRYSLDNISEISLSIGDNNNIFRPSRTLATAATVYIDTFKSKVLSDSLPHLNAKLRLGSFGLINPYVRFDKSNGRNVSYFLTADFTHAINDYPFILSNGQLHTKEKRDNSLMNSGHIEGGIVLNPTRKSSIAAKLYYYNNARHLPGPVIYYNNISHERLKEENMFAQMNYRNAFSSKISFLYLGKFNWSSSKYHDENGIYPGGELNQNYIQREIYLSNTLLYVPLTWLSASYSIDWFYNNLSDNLKSSSSPCRNSILQAVSAKMSLDRVTMILRTLFSIYSDKSKDIAAHSTNSRLSPSIAISWQLSESSPVFLRASYKNIFRMPTFNELYFDHYGSIGLKPETTDQFNLGVTYSLPFSESGLLSMTADAYLNRVKDKIVAIPYNLFIWTMTNLGKVRVYGVDVSFDLTFNFSEKYSFMSTGSYSYQRAQPRTSPSQSDWNKQVAYTPLNSGSLSLTQLNPYINLSLHATGTSGRYTSNSNQPSTRISGYIEAGAGLFREFKLGRILCEARADVINILNKQYEVIACYPMPGRSWQLSMKIKF